MRRSTRNAGIEQHGGTINANSLAVGPYATATATGNTLATTPLAQGDAGALRAALMELHKALGETTLPDEARIAAQTRAGLALEGVTDGDVKRDTIVTHVQQIGEGLKQANVAVAEGSSLWNSIRKLLPLLAPLVSGGRAVVASWFGVPL